MRAELEVVTGFLERAVTYEPPSDQENRHPRTGEPRPISPEPVTIRADIRHRATINMTEQMRAEVGDAVARVRDEFPIHNGGYLRDRDAEYEIKQVNRDHEARLQTARLTRRGTATGQG